MERALGGTGYGLPGWRTTISVRPNPSRGATTVAFALTEAAEVRLVVYDGREAAVLAEGRLPAGAHEVAFDAAGLPSGGYLVRLVVADPVRGAGERAETARFTLLR